MLNDELLTSLLREYGHVRSVASLLKMDHPVLRAIIKRRPEVNKLAQRLMQTPHRKPIHKIGVKQLLRQDLCAYCGIHPAETPQGRMTIDHVVPRSVGGENNAENMAGSCSMCNGKKASKDLLSFMLEIRN